MVFKKGYKPTSKHLENLRKSHLGLPSGNRGNHFNHSEKTKTKIRENARININYGMKNKNHSKETIKLISINRAGKCCGNNNPSKRPEVKKKQSEAHRGEKSYLWKGGISFVPYSVDWTNTLKRSIRERDRYICQLCNNEGLCVHHIDYNKKNCNPDNLITLCRKCHSKTNNNREYWTEFLRKMIVNY